MKKIAVCLHGIAAGRNFKGSGQPVTFRRERDAYFKNVFSKTNAEVDIFYHTWSTDVIDELNTQYKPTSSESAPPYIFSKPTTLDYARYARSILKNETTDLYRLNNIYSRWYSFKKAVDLALNNQAATGNIYDAIFVGRFDVTFDREIDLSLMDKDSFYLANWNDYIDSKGQVIDISDLINHADLVTALPQGYPHNTRGVSDLWFLAPPHKMKRFAEIFIDLPRLIATAGRSNHTIAEQKLREMNELDKIEKRLEVGLDFYISRWRTIND